jgi:hypothetical protein
LKRLFYDGNTKPARVGPALTTDALWIRTTNGGDQARYFYSTDGVRFEEFDPTFKLEFGMWTGDRLGF